tara:strand:- start:646 stop:2352 length:1707 start_codon:yes stop_codon:yes gene_type:complete
MSLIDFLKKKTPMVSLLSTTVKTEDTFRIATTAVTKKGFNTHGIMDYEWEIGKIRSSFFGTDLVSTATANFAAGFSSTSIISTIAINVSGLTEGEWITVPLKCTVNNEIFGVGFGADDYTETATDESLITVAYVDANGLVVDKQTKKRMYITNGQIKPQRILNTTFASHFSDEYNDVKQSDYAEGIEQRLLGLAAYTANNKVLTNVPIAISQGENDGWQSIQTAGGIIYKGRSEDDGSITIVDRHGNNALGKVLIGDIQRLKKKLSTHAKNASSVDNFYPIDFGPVTTKREHAQDQAYKRSVFVSHLDTTVSDWMDKENKNRLVKSQQALMYGLLENHGAKKEYFGYTFGEYEVVNLSYPSGVVKAVNLNTLRSLSDFDQLMDQLDEWAVTAPIKITRASNYKVTAENTFNIDYKIAPDLSKLLTLEYDGVGWLSLRSLYFNKAIIKYQFEIQTLDHKYTINTTKTSTTATGEKGWEKEIEASQIKKQSTLMKNEHKLETIKVGIGLPFLETPMVDYFLKTGWAKEYGIVSRDNIDVRINVPIEATVLDGKLRGDLHGGLSLTVDFFW